MSGWVSGCRVRVGSQILKVMKCKPEVTGRAAEVRISEWRLGSGTPKVGRQDS